MIGFTKFSILFLLARIYDSSASIESNIKNSILYQYDKNSLPVINQNSSVDLFYGNEVTGLVYFDQKAEQIKFNFITTLIWRDEYLRWDTMAEYSNISYIFVPGDRIWQPDIELYNAGSSPQLFELKSQVKIFKNGFVQYIRPTSFTFSCKLSLEFFPFDSQICKMLFGSWKYPKATLNLRPINSNDIHNLGNSYPLFNDTLSKLKNISISPLFSHNEWIITNIDVIHEDKTYLCCPNDLWPNSEFIIQLKRNPNKYVVVVIMSVLITISSLVIGLLNVDNYRRTYVLVFIPLTLIWLQIHVSSKIPVINYATKLEQVIQLCFYTTIISSFESGILYNFLLNHNQYLLTLHNYIEKKKVFIMIPNIVNKYNFVNKSYLYDNDNILNNSKIYNQIKNIDMCFKIILSIVYFSFLGYFLSV